MENDISTTSPVAFAVWSRLFVCFCLSTHVSYVRVRARFFLIASHCVLWCVHAVSISSHPSAIYLTGDLFPLIQDIISTLGPPLFWLWLVKLDVEG